VASRAMNYRAYWANKTRSVTRGESLEFRRLAGQELRLLFGDKNPVSVLEIGCGHGHFFDFFDFLPQYYRGVDFGPGLLATFHSSHPELDLVEAEGSSYRDARKYDLIFSHDVIEHFSRDMLDCHFRNARTMMHGESLLICAAVPWRELRTGYDMGIWSNGGRASIVCWGKSQISRMIGHDFMGHWYTTGEIATLARKHALGVRFHGSVAHPYRFHAVLWPEMGSLGS
jgi:SAM-dependent methyltransferase